MTRFFASTAIVLALGVTATLAISPRDARSITTSEASLAVDGAFRDGLYLGKLAAASRELPRLAVGRWSTAQDRSQFAAGYRRGYDEAFATNTKRAQSND
jgi:hypothetical protein